MNSHQRRVQNRKMVMHIINGGWAGNWPNTSDLFKPNRLFWYYLKDMSLSKRKQLVAALLARSKFPALEDAIAALGHGARAVLYYTIGAPALSMGADHADVNMLTNATVLFLLRA